MNALLAHRTLMRLAFSAAHAFAWVAMFDIFLRNSTSLPSALSSLVLTYALTHSLVVLLTPLAATNVRNGMRRAMVLAVLAAAAAFASFALGSLYGVAWALSVFAILLGIYRALYFIPYELAPASRRTGIEILMALMPAAAGLFLAWTGQPVALYGGAALLILVSALPLLRTPDKHEGFAWSYRRTFHELFASQHRPLLLSSVCDGIEGAVLLLIWPVAIWLILGQSFPLLGLVLSGTLLLTLAVRGGLALSGFVPTPLVAGAISMSAWVFRIFAGNGAAVIVVDSYTATGGNRRHGIDTAVYEQAADNHTYLDEMTALKEMGNALGRILLCLGVAILAPVNSISAVLLGAFLLAALASALSLYVSRSRTRRAF